MLFPRLQRFLVATKTSAAFGTFSRTVVKNVFPGLIIKTNHIRFATGFLHFVKRPKLFFTGRQFHSFFFFTHFQPLLPFLFFSKRVLKTPTNFSDSSSDNLFL